MYKPLRLFLQSIGYGAIFTRYKLSCLRRLLPILAVSVSPIVLSTELWNEVWSSARPQAWDGTGHYALAQIYDQSIFPDTFGWTHSFFAGMPFPNFYPPLFYWCVALLHQSHIFSFDTAFKLVLTLPALLLPAAIWMLSWSISSKNRLLATSAAFAILPLLVDYRFFNTNGLMGLHYSATFLLGLYTQTLGFVLLVAWYIIYCNAHQHLWRFALASVLLALALLANFFGATTAALFIASTVIYDVVKLRRATDLVNRKHARNSLIAHLISPLVAASLTLFWLAPMLGAYDYFVTRPVTAAMHELVPSVMWAWYVLALAGIILWLRRPTQTMWPYLATCIVLAGGVFFAATVAPRWLPLHPPRLISTLNFLLAVPVGHALASVLQGMVNRLIYAPSHRQRLRGRVVLHREANSLHRTFNLLAMALALLICAFVLIRWMTPSSYSLAFYQTKNSERIDPVLRFAEQRRDGRYLVEIPPFSDVEAALDGRAINSYLGAQGNEASSLFFREAAPNVIFFNPLVNALSLQPDAFGISSVLADDMDFIQQPLARHLERARFIGVRYLVMTSQVMKNRLAGEPSIKAQHDFEKWSVFELRDEPLPRVRTLAYRPALVISSFSFKQRRRNEYDFIRLAEEQFADGWFDVLLTRSPESKIDRLTSLEGFGALVIDTYECDDEMRAYARLRELAQHRPLILLSSEATLFRRIRESMSDFPQAEIIERTTEEPGAWLASGTPTTHYGTTSIRRVWRAIQQTLDRHKIATGAAPTATLSSEIKPSMISIRPGANLTEDVPVLITTTFHPNWQREDGEAIYPATPFFMLTFVRESTAFRFARCWSDWLGLMVSMITFLLLCGITIWHYRQHLARLVAVGLALTRLHRSAPRASV